MAPGDVDLTCEDCQQSFPLLQSVSGRCKRCAVADRKEYRSAEWEQVMRWPQCVMCGVSAKNMMPPAPGGQQTCDSSKCVQLAVGGATTSTSVSAANSQGAAQELPHTISQRSGTLFQALQLSQSQASGQQSMTTESLQARENIMRANANIASGKKADSVIVELKYRLSSTPKRINETYGSSKLPMAETMTLYDVQDYAVDQFNIVHTKKGARKPILVSETLLRQSDNRTIDTNKMGFTLKKWFDLQVSDGLVALPSEPAPFSVKPGAKKVAPASLKPLIALELFVLEEMYEERLERSQVPLSIESEFSGGSKRRDRAPSMLEATGGQGPSKVARGSDFGIGSAFSLVRGAPPTGPLVTSSRVEVQQIKCIAMSPQGDPIFVKGDRSTVFLADKPFAKGTMKAVFDLVHQHQTGSRYVAKRLFTLEGFSGESIQEEGPSNSTHMPTTVRIPKVTFGVQEHNKYIQADCGRLVQGRAFLKSFKKFAVEKGIFIYQDLRFTRAHLLQELGPESSPASGMSSEDRDWLLQFTPLSSVIDDEESGLMWLVEKRHSSNRVQRFSGTLKHPSESTDLLHLTVYAFNHYTYGHSNGEMVFADLQGTPCSIKQDDGRTTEGFELFDPMMHTITQSSGIGDFGKEGINTFLQQHQCREICEGLGLDKSVPLTPITEDSLEETNKKRDVTDSDGESEQEEIGDGDAQV